MIRLRPKTSLSTPLALAAALLLPPLAAPTLAQTAPTAATSPRPYDLPAGPLSATLNRIAREAGLTLTLDGAIASGLTAPAVRGSLTPEQALTQALSSSSLELVRTTGDGYTVRPRPSTTLPTVTVHGMQAQERALGPVQGYIARRSISATKTDTPLIETAQTVNIVTADQIAIQNAESLVQAFQYTAGVQAMGTDNTTSDGMIIRGFNVTGASPMYLNGAKLARATFNGISEPYAMERIELLKGPASVLYGNAAPGGIINMVSKQPQVEPLRELKLQLGSFQRRQVAGDFAGKLNEDGTLSYRVTGLVRRSNTAVDHIPDDRNFGAVALRWAPDTDTSLTLLANTQRNDTVYNYGLPAAGTVAPNVNGRIPRDRFTGEPGFNTFETRNHTLGYLLSHRVNDTVTLRQNLLYARSRTAYADIYAAGLDADQRRIARGPYTRNDRDQSVSLDNQLEAKWRTGAVEHTTLLGMDYTHTRFARVAYSGTVAPIDLFDPVYGAPVTLAADPNADYVSKTRQLGLYAQQHMKLDDRWVLTLGGRYDKVRATSLDRPTGQSDTDYDDGAFTGRVGVVRLLPNGWAPYASFAQSFEPASGRAFNGTAFQPTTGDQFEVGVRYQPPGTEHAFTASVYQLTQQNVTTPDLARPGFSVQEGEVRSRGLELEARAHLDDGLSLIASYGYVDNAVTRSNANTLGNRFGGVPRHTAALWLDYAVNDALNVGAGVRYQSSSKNLANTEDVPGYTVVDAVLGYRLTQAWQLSLNLHNVFDRRYVTCSYACFYGKPRTAIATLGYRW